MDEPEVTNLVPEYVTVMRGHKSLDDKVAIVLKVGDWQRIAEEWHLDADAENLGPAEHACFLEGDPGDDAARDRARQHDAERTMCHDSGAATERCATTVEETLARYGWVTL